MVVGRVSVFDCVCAKWKYTCSTGEQYHAQLAQNNSLSASETLFLHSAGTAMNRV
jgi:hypothetical protein